MTPAIDKPMRYLVLTQYIKEQHTSAKERHESRYTHKASTLCGMFAGTKSRFKVALENAHYTIDRNNYKTNPSDSNDDKKFFGAPEIMNNNLYNDYIDHVFLEQREAKLNEKIKNAQGK